MFILLKEIAVIVASVVGALLISLGVATNQAVAPDTTLPAPLPSSTVAPSDEIEQSQLEENPPIPEEGVSEPKEDKKETIPEVSAVSTTPTKPLIDDFEKSLQEALDALAKIQKTATPQNTSVSDDFNTTVRSSIVNIICSTSGGSLNPISASGVVIDPRGIIITNAHVAQYFLLEDYPALGTIECIARTGSPAKPAYTLDLLFISPSWIVDNAQKIDDIRPTGNGAHDYALVQVTGFIAAPDIPVPPQFTYIPLITDAPRTNDSVLLAGYPAGFLGGLTIQKELYAASAPAKVRQLFTFETVTADLFSIGGSIVAQQGSSGGAVAIENTKSPSGAALLGLIVTSSDAPSTDGRDLRALSTEYIIRDFAEERGIPLAQYLARDLNQERALFSLTTAPTLSAALVSVLEN